MLPQILGTLLGFVCAGSLFRDGYLRKPDTHSRSSPETRPSRRNRRSRSDESYPHSITSSRSHSQIRSRSWPRNPIPLHSSSAHDRDDTEDDEEADDYYGRDRDRSHRGRKLRRRHTRCTSSSGQSRVVHHDHKHDLSHESARYGVRSGSDTALPYHHNHTVDSLALDATEVAVASAAAAAAVEALDRREKTVGIRRPGRRRGSDCTVYIDESDTSFCTTSSEYGSDDEGVRRIDRERDRERRREEAADEAREVWERRGRAELGVSEGKN